MFSSFLTHTHYNIITSLYIDLEWKVVYVGKAEDCKSDLVLDEILVGPVPVGVNKFVLQADAPSTALLSPDDVLGVTVVLITCSYREREFVRVGYYVNNEYSITGEEYDQELQGPLPPKPPVDVSLVTRHILADKPRVTKFPIPWGDSNTKEEQVSSIMHDGNHNGGDENVVISPSSQVNNDTGGGEVLVDDELVLQQDQDDETLGMAATTVSSE